MQTADFQKKHGEKRTKKFFSNFFVTKRRIQVLYIWMGNLIFKSSGYCNPLFFKNDYCN